MGNQFKGRKLLVVGGTAATRGRRSCVRADRGPHQRRRHPGRRAGARRAAPVASTPSTRSGALAHLRTWRRSSFSCCPTRRAGWPAPSGMSTAAWWRVAT